MADWHAHYLAHVPKEALRLFEESPNLTELTIKVITRPNFYSVESRVRRTNLDVRKLNASTSVNNCSVCSKKTFPASYSLLVKPSCLKLWWDKADASYTDIMKNKKYPSFIYNISCTLRHNLSSSVKWGRMTSTLCSLECEQKLFEELRFFFVSNA